MLAVILCQLARIADVDAMLVIAVDICHIPENAIAGVNGKDR